MPTTLFMVLWRGQVDCLDPEGRTCPALDAMATQLCRGLPMNAGTLLKDIVDGGE